MRSDRSSEGLCFFVLILSCTRNTSKSLKMGYTVFAPLLPCSSLKTKRTSNRILTNPSLHIKVNNFNLKLKFIKEYVNSL